MASPASVQAFIDHQADQAPDRYDDLRAVIFNGTLKRSPEPSYTDGLLAIVRGIFERVGVGMVEVRTVDHVIPPGVWPDMREHGYERDDFAAIYRDAVAAADIVLICGPIWLDQSSHTRKRAELCQSGELNAVGQWSYYGKVGAVLSTGNEDGGKHASAQTHALQHIGLTVPHRPTPTGTGRPDPDRHTSTPRAAASRTRGRHATPCSWLGTCCISRA